MFVPPYNYTYTGGNSAPLTVQESFAPVGSLDLSFEIDFWGRLRRTTEAAWADLLASAEAR